jgi:hypothetical protein
MTCKEKGQTRPFELEEGRLDDRDEAFFWIGRAVDGRDPLIVPIKSYPLLDPLREAPRFEALLGKLNLLD